MHSVKMGAASVLLNAAAAGRLDPARVSQLLKHKGASTMLSDTSVGYATNREALAVANRSHRAARFLLLDDRYTTQPTRLFAKRK